MIMTFTKMNLRLILRTYFSKSNTRLYRKIDKESFRIDLQDFITSDK